MDEIDMILWNGDNHGEIAMFLEFGNNAGIYANEPIRINTPSGMMTVNVGDYIVKTGEGKYYPMTVS